MYEPNNAHWRLENFRERVLRKQAQDILINHPTLVFAGRLYDMKAKHIGAGVYEVFKVLHKTN